MGYSITVKEDVINYIVTESNYAKYGARAILRKVKTELEDTLSRAIVDKMINKREEFYLSAESGKVMISPIESAVV